MARVGQLAIRLLRRLISMTMIRFCSYTYWFIILCLLGVLDSKGTQ